MSKEYQKTTGTAQSLDEGVQQMRAKVLEYEVAVEEKERKLKEVKLRYLLTSLTKFNVFWQAKYCGKCGILDSKSSGLSLSASLDPLVVLLRWTSISSREAGGGGGR